MVTNVTSCFLIDLCGLCGSDVKRGVCLPEKKLSKCQCFININDSSRPYTGDFCYPTNVEPSLTSTTPSVEPSLTSSTPSWTPIVVGVLAGFAGLLCAITCCLVAIAAWRRRRQPSNDK